MVVDIIITKSNKTGKKYDAVIEGKKQFHSDKLARLILQNIRMKQESKITLRDTEQEIKTGLTTKRAVCAPKIFSGTSQQ